MAGKATLTTKDSTDPNYLIFQFVDETKEGKYTEEKPATFEDENRRDLTEEVFEEGCIYLGIA